MKAFQLLIEGNWAHFKKPETNNNPLTHDFITKTAFVGLIGSVLGIERKEMRPLFPQLCEDLLYGVQIVNPVKKESWGFTMRKAVNIFAKAPKHMEFLKKPKYIISVALENSRSENTFNNFNSAIKKSEAKYSPVLGLHNCPANLNWISEGEFSAMQKGEFEAKCVISNQFKIDITGIEGFRVGFERIPSYQNDDFWNLPEKYVKVIYPSEGKKLNIVEGKFYEYYNGECWWLI